MFVNETETYFTAKQLYTNYFKHLLVGYLLCFRRIFSFITISLNLLCPHCLLYRTPLLLYYIISIYIYKYVCELEHLTIVSSDLLFISSHQLSVRGQGIIQAFRLKGQASRQLSVLILDQGRRLLKEFVSRKLFASPPDHQCETAITLLDRCRIRLSRECKAAAPRLSSRAQSLKRPFENRFSASPPNPPSTPSSFNKCISKSVIVLPSIDNIFS